MRRLPALSNNFKKDTRSWEEGRNFFKISSLTLYLNTLSSDLIPFYSFYITHNKCEKQVCQQEKDQLRGVQVRTTERRGVLLRKELLVETVNEWLLETRMWMLC